MKRFNYQGRKISKDIQFQEQLNLDKYMVQADGDKALYELIGTVVHLGGSLFSGHYIAHVKRGMSWFTVARAYLVQRQQCLAGRLQPGRQG